MTGRPLAALTTAWPAMTALSHQALTLPPAPRGARFAALPAKADGLKETVARLLAASGGIEPGSFLATLEQPYIARLHDAGVDTRGWPWLALEYVQGQPVDEHARDKALDEKQRVQTLLQVCKALARAHSRLVIHHDTKPDNIPVTEEGHLELLGFGIAKMVRCHDARG
jgi:serine/threonine protein kinase